MSLDNIRNCLSDTIKLLLRRIEETEIIFRFSQPMETGITALELNEEAELFIDDTWYDTHDDEPEYWKDEYTYIIRVGKKLESGKKYGIVIPSSLYNKNGINTADDYVYEFYVK